MSELFDALRAQRIEFAGEVHDRIIPPLFAARMQLEALAARLNQSTAKDVTHSGAGSAPAPATVAEIQQAGELIQLAISASRRLLVDLVPHEAGAKHWESQLRQALGGRELQLHQVGTLPWDRIESDVAVTLTSITEEAVRNAIRHGEPSRIEIRIQRVGNTGAGSPTASDQDLEVYRLTIIDDGKGFEPSLATDHHGLHLMRLRATAIGGRLEISSRPGGPTAIAVQWPLSARQSG